MKTRRLASFVSSLAAAALVLSACGASNSGGGDGGDSEAGQSVDQDWTNCTPGSESADAADIGVDDNKNLTMAVFNGWDETYATVYLIKNVLEQDGYKVEVPELEAGPAYQALARGDVDFITDAWLPLTHSSYIDKVGDKTSPQGCWYDTARNTIAVNEDSPAKSIEDLKDMGDEYDNTIVGIEAGAGLTKAVKEQVIPEYGLDNITHKISSTAAMLAALKKATDAGDNIAVTLWRPHWAYDAFPIRDLEDPKKALGENEIIYNFGNNESIEEYPYVGQILKNFVFPDEDLASLENIMFSDDHYGGENYDAAVQEWLKENPDFADNLRKGELAKK